MGDLTPVPWRYSKYESNRFLGFIDSNFPRTCGSFDKVFALGLTSGGLMGVWR